MPALLRLWLSGRCSSLRIRFGETFAQGRVEHWDGQLARKRVLLTHVIGANERELARQPANSAVREVDFFLSVVAVTRRQSSARVPTDSAEREEHALALEQLPLLIEIISAVRDFRRERLV